MMNSDRLNRLSEPQRQLLAQRLRRELPNKPKLVAYASGQSGTMLDPSDLKDWLKCRVPSHMVPDAVVALEHMPRLPNGKINARALAQIPLVEEAAPIGGIVAPSNAVEATLASIWSKLLDVEPISVTDDFFELGGDSLVSIRMVSMARQEGIQIQPADLPDHPTIRALAKMASDVSEAPSDHGAKDAPLLPIQAWHLGRGLPQPAHWNQAVRCILKAPLDLSTVQNVFDAIAKCHPGLCATFHQSDGEWRQKIAEAPTIKVRWSDKSAADLVPEISKGMILDKPLFEACLLSSSDGKGQEILLIANHLVVDAVSWSVLLDDLDVALQDAASGRDVVLADAVSPLDLALDVARYASSDRTSADVAIWLKRDAHLVSAEFGTEAQAGSISFELKQDETADLLGSANTAYNTQPFDLLFWAMAEAQMARLSQSDVQIDIEGHGRQPDFSKLDLSRAVGWLTTFTPINCDMSSLDMGDRGKGVKEELRAHTENAASYGAVRYLGKYHVLSARLGQAQTTDVLLNYLGQIGESKHRLISLADAPQEGLRAPDSPRSHLYEFNVSVRQGTLRIELIYGNAAQSAPAAEAFLQDYIAKLRQILALCKSAEQPGFTPSDFPEAGISQDDLDAFLDEL